MSNSGNISRGFHYLDICIFLLSFFKSLATCKSSENPEYFKSFKCYYNKQEEKMKIYLIDI